MNHNDKILAHLLLVKFGLAPYDLTEQKLANIKKEIISLNQSSGIPTEKDWINILRRHCPTTGTRIYAGEDNSDLITLLTLAQKK